MSSGDERLYSQYPEVYNPGMGRDKSVPALMSATEERFGDGTTARGSVFVNSMLRQIFLASKPFEALLTVLIGLMPSFQTMLNKTGGAFEKG
jgi:hypothetical protein